MNHTASNHITCAAPLPGHWLNQCPCTGLYNGMSCVRAAPWAALSNLGIWCEPISIKMGNPNWVLLAWEMSSYRIPTTYCPPLATIWNTKAIVTKASSLSVQHSLSQEFCKPGCVLADTCSTSETLQRFAQAQLAELSSETQELSSHRNCYSHVDMEAYRWCFQSRFPSLLNVEALPWGSSDGFGPPCHLWQKGISQTRRGSYQTDGRQDIAEEEMGTAPTAHDSSTWCVPEIRENDGYERDKRGRERKKKAFWPKSRGKGSFLSSDLMVQPGEKCKRHQVLPSQRGRAGSNAAPPFLSLCTPPASAWPEAGVVLSCHQSRVYREQQWPGDPCIM